MTNALVSILIPAHNAQRWIAQTIRSAVKQTWARTETIVVDDGSSDRTLSVAQQFASKNVVVVTQPNAGASDARNKAYQLCQGEYIQWLDADDLLAPDKIEVQMRLAERLDDRRTLLSSGWGWFLHRVSKTQFKPDALWNDLSAKDWLVRKMGENLHMQTATWLVSRELTDAAGPWDTRLSLDDDGEYFCRVLRESNGVRFAPDAKVFYRSSGGGSLSNVGRSNEKLESQFLSMQLHIQYLRSLEDSARVRTACLAYLQTWLAYFLPSRPDLALSLEQLARSLGGQLHAPLLRRKYRWLARVFGDAAAKRTQSLLPRVRWDAARLWDKALARLEDHRAEIGRLIS